MHEPLPSATPTEKGFQSVFQQLSRYYFQDMFRALDYARERNGGGEDVYLEIAGLKIVLRLPGGLLSQRLLPVFSHLLAPASSRVDLTICCLDYASLSRETLLPPRALLEDLPPHQFQFQGQTDSTTFFHHQWMQVLSGLDLENKQAFYCVENLELWPFCERAMPMKHLLNPFFNRRGKQFIHAACIGLGPDSLILTAPGGHGKSSTALTALENGLLYSSDDMCLISDGETPHSYSLYNSAKLREGGIDRLPGVQSHLTHFEEFGERKAFFYVHQHYPERIQREGRIRAVLFPEVTGNPQSQLVPATGLEVMRESLPSTLKLLPNLDFRAQRILMNLYARVPAYRLLLGEDPVQLSQLLRELLT